MVNYAGYIPSHTQVEESFSDKVKTWTRHGVINEKYFFTDNAKDMNTVQPLADHSGHTVEERKRVGL